MAERLVVWPVYHMANPLWVLMTVGRLTISSQPESVGPRTIVGSDQSIPSALAT